MRTLLPLLLLLPACNFCWPRGGSPGQCTDDDDSARTDDDDISADDDDATADDDDATADDDDATADDDDLVDDDDATADDDDATADDDDATDDPCLAPRPRPAAFDLVDSFGYGMVTTDSTDAPAYCWFEDGIDDETVNMHTGGATDSHDDVDWDVQWYGQVAERVAMDINGAIHFHYTTAVSPNNSCDFSWASDDEPILAAFWDDLNMTADGAGTIRYGTVGDEPNRALVLWYDQIWHDDYQGDGISFQVHVFEADHHVEVHYQDVSFGDSDVDGGESATIGVYLDQDTNMLFECDDSDLRDNFTIAYWPPEVSR